MKWCPSVGPWIVTVDGWHPHEEMQIQHMTLHVYQWNPTLCLLQHGSRTYGAKFGTSSNSSEAPWSMKSYHTQTIRVYSQGVNVGKYLKLKSSSWDKPTFHKDDRTWVYRTEPIRKWIFMAILTSWYKFATTLLHFVPQKIGETTRSPCYHLWIPGVVIGIQVSKLGSLEWPRPSGVDRFWRSHTFKYCNFCACLFQNCISCTYIYIYIYISTQLYIHMY